MEFNFRFQFFPFATLEIPNGWIDLNYIPLEIQPRKYQLLGRGPYKTQKVCTNNNTCNRYLIDLSFPLSTNFFIGNGKDCTDNFRVKWWPDNEPNNYTLSKLLEPKVRQFTVAHLMPGTYYGFQVQSTIQNLDNVSTICNDVNFFLKGEESTYY